VGWVHPAVGGVLALAPDALGRGIAAVVRTLPRVPGGFFHTADFSWPWMVVVYGLTAGWVWRERLGVSRRRLAIAALASAAVFLWTGGPRPPAHVRATFLAVGGGSTTLLELPSGLALLYDAGSSLSHARAGEAVTAPVLWSRGLTRVDAVFLSHAHFDHFKDLLPLVERFGVRRVYVPPTFLRRRLASDDRLVEALLARGVRVEFFGAGDRLAGTGGVEVRALWPRGPASQTKEINDGSLVLEVADGGRRLLLTGDLEAAGIDGLLAAEPLLRADAMLWPHHGHEPEAVGRLARRAGARVLVVSAKCPPAPPRAPDWAADLGAAYFHTGWSGAVTVELRPQGPHVETFGGGPAAPPALAQGDDETDAEDGEPWP